MSITSEKKNHYLQLLEDSAFPEDAEGIGTFMDQDNQPMISLWDLRHTGISSLKSVSNLMTKNVPKT